MAEIWVRFESCQGAVADVMSGISRLKIWFGWTETKLMKAGMDKLKRCRSAMVTRIVSTGILFVLIFSITKAQAASPTLLSYEELQALKPYDREVYLYGLQELLVRVNDLDIEAGVQFLSQNETDRRRSKNRLFADTEAVFALIRGEKASAAEQFHQCIYAGWIQDLSMDNAKCPRPPQGSCGSGYIECNPMVFGSGICIKPQQTATKACQAGAKRPEVVWQEIQSRKDDWENFRKQVDSFCDRPGKREIETCGTVKVQLGLIREMVTGGAAAPAPVKPPPPVVVAPPRPPAPPPAVTQAPPPLPPTGGGEADDDYKELQTSISPAENAMLKDGRCNFGQLIERVELPDDFSARKDREENPLLSLGEAQRLYCEKGPVDPTLITARKEKLTKLISDLRTIRAPNQSDKKGSHTYRAKIDYFSFRYNLLRKNLDNCWREAQQKRASGAMPTQYQKKLSIRYEGSSPRTAYVTDLRTQKTSVLSESYVFAMLDGVHVCEISDGSAGPNPGSGTSIRWNAPPVDGSHAR